MILWALLLTILNRNIHQKNFYRYQARGDSTVEESVPVEDWCTCGNCAEMADADENICCKTSDLTVGSLESYDCITDHRNFDEIVLNPVILEVAIIQIMALKGQTGRAPDHILNRYSFIY